MTVRSFADTSSVSLAYAIGDGTTAADFAAQDFHFLPYTQEGFQMTKEPKSSTAITNDRRPTGAKNTKGSASGAATIEFGAAPFVLDMLSMTLMNDWKMVDVGDPTKGTYLLDGEVKKFMAVEKTSKAGPNPTDKLFHERYYGTLVNDCTIEMGDGELITMAMNTISMFAEYGNALAGANGLGGSIARAKLAPDDYEIADSSNNLTRLVIKDAQGNPLEMTFSDASLQIQNNAREQAGLGAQFAVGVGFGRVGVSLSGEVYFYDQTVLDAHMQNKRVSAEMTLETLEGIFTVTLPSLMAQSPSNSADGENQDYKTQITLSAEKGQVTIGGVQHDCVIAITYKAKP